MVYYTKDNKLYAMDTPVEDSGFVKITEEEYNDRLNNAVIGREKGNPVSDNDDEVVTFDEVTETDYINALESLGVEFNG